MKYRRNVSQLADSLQTCAAEIFCSLIHQSSPCSCLCGTSGCYDDDVICDQLLHQLDVCAVRSYLRVVTPYHSNCSTQNAGSDALDKRLGGTELVYLRVCYGIQLLYNCLEGITNRCLLLLARNMYKLRLSVLEILDCHLYDSLCIFCRILRAEADELCIRHLCNRGSRHEFGVEALGQRP